MLSMQFCNSLSVLTDRMGKCFPHFVRYTGTRLCVTYRCIKPNLFQRAHDFQDDLVKTQLLYTG
jgi:myosin heavy subunit